MKAADLITLANSKGYSTSRTKPNHYQTHQTVDGKHVTVDFFGKWSEFVKYVKSL
jgi:predicted RNA binding protein YcfA (HicA-like mRNA interferase family)